MNSRGKQIFRDHRSVRRDLKYGQILLYITTCDIRFIEIIVFIILY